MDAGKDECRKGRIHERRESRLEGYRKGGFRTGEIRNGRDAIVLKTGVIKDSWEAGQVGYRTGGNQNWRDSILEGFRTGGIQEKGDSGKEEGRNLGKE